MGGSLSGFVCVVVCCCAREKVIPLEKDGGSMRLEEFKEMLSGFDPEAIVVVSGYEGGVDDDIAIEFKMIALDVNEKGYDGPHVIVGDGVYDRRESEFPGKEIRPCVYIRYKVTGE